jgi:hypothetical protein
MACYAVYEDGRVYMDMGVLFNDAVINRKL